MDYRKLNGTDIDVSVIAMGCWAIVGDTTWGAQDEAQSLATIQAALDTGINFFDTAEAYGNGYSETLLGKALKGQRDRAVIASKVSGANLAPADLRAACERSLERLDTDYIDLYQIHWPNHDVPLAETMGELGMLRDEGKIRAIGVCNFGVGDMGDLLEIGTVATNQLPYSLLWRAIEYGIVQQSIDNNIGILCYSPLMQGLLTGKFKRPEDVPEGRARTRHFGPTHPQVRHTDPGCESETFEAIDQIRRIGSTIGASMGHVALAWLLHQPGVTSVLAGARTPEQIKDNAATADVKLPKHIVEQLGAATEDVKQRLGSNPDMWSSDSRFR